MKKNILTKVNDDIDGIDKNGNKYSYIDSIITISDVSGALEKIDSELEKIGMELYVGAPPDGDMDFYICIKERKPIGENK